MHRLLVSLGSVEDVGAQFDVLDVFPDVANLLLNKTVLGFLCPHQQVLIRKGSEFSFELEDKI